MNASHFFIFLSLFTLVACTDGASRSELDIKPADGIVGGTFAKENDEIALNVVSIRQSGLSLCSGTLIEEDIVLTAAHCFDGMTQLKDLDVVFSVDANSKSAISIPVEKILIHREFRHGKEWLGENKYCLATETCNSAKLNEFLSSAFLINDIALVKIEKKASARSKVALIGNDALPTKFTAILAGYGKQDYKEDGASGTLKFFNEKVEYFSSGSKILVKTSAENLTNSGDSGGPLFIRKDNKLVQIGLLTGSMVKEVNSIYQSLAFYNDWIVSSTKEIQKQKEPLSASWTLPHAPGVNLVPRSEDSSTALSVEDEEKWAQIKMVHIKCDNPKEGFSVKAFIKIQVANHLALGTFNTETTIGNKKYILNYLKDIPQGSYDLAKLDLVPKTSHYTATIEDILSYVNGTMTIFSDDGVLSLYAGDDEDEKFYRLTNQIPKRLDLAASDRGVEFIVDTPTGRVQINSKSDCQMSIYLK